MEEIKSKIEDLEQEKHRLYYDGYMDNSKEIQEIEKQLNEAYMELLKKDTAKPQAETEEQKDGDESPIPPLPDLPTIDLSLNKKTGECVIKQRDNSDEIFEIKMDARDYTRAGLKMWRKIIETNEKLPKEDRKYIKNIDPTLYNAYKLYDMEKSGKYNQSAAKMYVDSVIKQSKALEQGQESEEIKMPGNVNIDIGWHPGKSNERGRERKFGLTKLLSSVRADKILSHHGGNFTALSNNMNLAKVKNNKKIFATLGGLLAASALSSNLLLSEPVAPLKDNSNETEFSSEVKDDKKKQEDGKDNVLQNKEKIQKDSKEKAEKIYPGDIVTVERWSQIYRSVDSEMADSAFNDKKMVGVNKIACTIDGEIYSTATYSANEIYKMAEKAGVKVDYHVDEATNIGGKNCVQVNEKGNPSPIYIYNENGVTKQLSGAEWKGDVEYGIGWIRGNDVKKSKAKQGKTKEKEEVSHQKNIEKEPEQMERI